MPNHETGIIEEEPVETPRITRGDVFASWLRWLFFSHANYNWERLQGTGFAHAMTPVIRKLYRSPEEVRAALLRHVLFFNTEPDTGGVIHGMTIAMEEQRARGYTEIDDEAINNVKIGLMGPFAGLGDTLKQGTWFPVWQSIGIGLAVGAAGAISGLLGPAIYLAAAIAYTWVLGWYLYYQGYVRGENLVTNMLATGLLDRVRTGAAVLGAGVLGALGAQFVTVSTGISWTIQTGSGEELVEETFSVQERILDALMPGLLPLATLLFIIWLLRRRASIVSVILALFGITLASALIESVTRYAGATGNTFGVFGANGVPTLIGIAVLILAAYGFAILRRRPLINAHRFVIGFLVVALVLAFVTDISGRTEPIQILGHF